MKFTKRFAALILCIGFVALPAAMLVNLTGCKDSPQTVAYKTEGVVLTTVDGAMNFWHDWVVAHKATQAQVDAVKKAYNVYYDAQQLLKTAIEAGTDLATVQANATTSEVALLDLINTFTGKKNP